jgi:hypothetical protein
MTGARGLETMLQRRPNQSPESPFAQQHHSMASQRADDRLRDREAGCQTKTWMPGEEIKSLVGLFQESTTDQWGRVSD